MLTSNREATSNNCNCLRESVTVSHSLRTVNGISDQHMAVMSSHLMIQHAGAPANPE